MYHVPSIIKSSIYLITDYNNDSHKPFILLFKYYLNKISVKKIVDGVVDTGVEGSESQVSKKSKSGVKRAFRINKVMIF
jgi:hypothetical protein